MTTCDIIDCREKGQRYHSKVGNCVYYLCTRHSEMFDEREKVEKLLRF